MIKKCTIFAFLMLLISFSFAQLGEKKNAYTHADTLRGSLNENRDWWDVLRYDITVKPDFNAKTIEGKVVVIFKEIKAGHSKIQIDLQKPLLIDSITVGPIEQRYAGTFPAKQERVAFNQDTALNVAYFNSKPTKNKYKLSSFIVYYHGKPREAKFPPWDGGWIWKKDKNGNPWMSVACQGLGASAWYPCKDHQSDEPDGGASLTIIVPDSLVAVANGRLESTNKENGWATYKWVVKNPINNYLIIPTIGKYVNFTDTLMGEKGQLDESFWVLDYNLDKAKEQFKQAKLMLRAFEYWFGPYPFYEDSYKLVESPHLGMEHQSATAYGNQFKNGYLGRDLSGTGWGLKWDYIIVHESGHEWFANNITSKDIADMWVHEGITDYSETLFTEYYYGKEAGNDYNYGQRRGIRNDEPIIGKYGVNKEGSGDMYAKGANMMHTIRHSIHNDSLFRDILRGLSKTFYHQTVTTGQIESFISEQAGFNYGKVFDQYLRDIRIPVLELGIDSLQHSITYKWSNCVEGFNLPLSMDKNNQSLTLYPETKEKTTVLTPDQMQLVDVKLIDRLYYIKIKQQ
jgi:aminopeptidase N